MHTLTASAADWMAYEGHFKPLTCRTGPYWAISTGAEYAKIDQKGIWNTVSINRLARVAEESRLNVRVTSDSRTNMDPSSVQDASIKKEENPYAVEEMSDTKTDLRRHNILFDCMATNPRATQSNLPSTVPTI